jgi:hypothetical protein
LIGRWDSAQPSLATPDDLTSQGVERDRFASFEILAWHDFHGEYSLKGQSLLDSILEPPSGPKRLKKHAFKGDFKPLLAASTAEGSDASKDLRSWENKDALKCDHALAPVSTGALKLPHKVAP